MLILRCDYCNTNSVVNGVPSQSVEYETTVHPQGKAVTVKIIVTPTSPDEHICRKCAKGAATKIR